MRITQITVNFTETCNLGDYSNTKPSVELTAILDAGDDVQAVLSELVTTAKSVIHDKIDDELERVDKPPKYWAGERYDVIYSHTTRIVAIVPMNSITQLDGGYYAYLEGVRYPAAQKAAHRKRSQIGNEEAVTLFDCATVDTIVALREYTTEQNRIYEQKQQERRAKEEAERQRQHAEWEARRRRELEEEDDDDDFEEDDDDNE